MEQPTHVLIVGGGVIGCSIAYLVNDLKSGQMVPSGRTYCPESEAAQPFKARELASEADDSSRFWKFGRSEQRAFRATGDRSCFVWRNHFSPDILFLNFKGSSPQSMT
jgi:hypothetical protein